jgi:hypothetical protein
MNGHPDRPAEYRLVDYPASYHSGAGGFSFADGQAEINKWLDHRTKIRVNRRRMRKMKQRSILRTMRTKTNIRVAVTAGLGPFVRDCGSRAT